ncbi:hypothetical protein D3C81_1168390 [compost metagenome]
MVFALVAQAARPGFSRCPVRIRDGQARRSRGHKTRVAHGQRHRHQIFHGVRQRHAGRLFDNGAQHIGGNRVCPALARCIRQRHGGQAAQIVLQGNAGRIHAVGHPGLRIRAARRLEEAIVEAGRVREQMPHGDGRHRTVRLARRKIRQPACHQVVQAQPALPHQRQRGRRHDGLADGRQAEDGVLNHGYARLEVQVAGRAAVHVLATLAHQDDGTHQALLLQNKVEQGIDAGGQGRRREVVHHGVAFQMIRLPR